MRVICTLNFHPSLTMDIDEGDTIQVQHHASTIVTPPVRLTNVAPSLPNIGVSRAFPSLDGKNTVSAQKDAGLDVHLKNVTDMTKFDGGRRSDEEWTAQVDRCDTGVDQYTVTTRTRRRGLNVSGKEHTWQTTTSRPLTRKEADKKLRAKYNEKLQKGYKVVITTSPSPLFLAVVKQRQERADKKKRKRAAETGGGGGKKKSSRSGGGGGGGGGGKKKSSSSGGGGGGGGGGKKGGNGACLLWSSSTTDGDFYSESAAASSAYVGELVPIKKMPTLYYRTDADLIKHCTYIWNCMNRDGFVCTIYVGMMSTNFERWYDSIRKKLRPACIMGSPTATTHGQCTQVTLFRLSHATLHQNSTVPHEVALNQLEVEKENNEHPNALSTHAKQESLLQEFFTKKVTLQRMESRPNRGGNGGRNLPKQMHDDGQYVLFLEDRKQHLESDERGDDKGGTRVKHERAKQVPANRKKQVPADRKKQVPADRKKGSGLSNPKKRGSYKKQVKADRKKQVGKMVGFSDVSGEGQNRKVKCDLCTKIVSFGNRKTHTSSHK